MNSANKRRAHEEAATQWRETQQCPILLTDERIACHTGQGWRSFYYGRVIGLQVAGDEGTVVVEFSDGCHPLRLTTADASVVAVYLCWALWGAQGIRDHPALGSIRLLAATTTPPLH